MSRVFNPGTQLRNHLVDLTVLPLRRPNNRVPSYVETVIQRRPSQFTTLKAGGHQIPLQNANAVPRTNQLNNGFDQLHRDHAARQNACGGEEPIVFPATGAIR